MLHLPAASSSRTDEQSNPHPSQRPSPLFERLRAETAPAHRNLESRLDLGRDSLDAVRYVELLHGFRRAVGAYEAVAASAIPAPLQPMFEARRKTALLDDDLGYFGAAAQERESDLGDARRVVDGDPCRAIGAMYVFEGSTLGGAVVSRHLERHIGLPDLKGRSYFMPYPGRIGAMWRAFKNRVDAVVGEDRRAIDVIAAGANATFDWLSQTLPRTH